MRFLILIFCFFTAIYANDYKDTKVIHQFSHNINKNYYSLKDIKQIIRNQDPTINKVYIYLENEISEEYYLIWDGNIKQLDNDIYNADGKGSILFIRKIDGYQSIKQNVTIKEGEFVKLPVLDHSKFYKCLDEECYEKEYKSKLTYLEEKEDINKTIIKLKEEEYTYKGLLDINKTIKLNGIGSFETGSSTYSGEFKDGNITGYGTFKTKLNNNLNLEIEQQGLWDNGRFKSGYLSTVYQDGGIYKGVSRNGKPNGEGTFIWSDKSSYTGAFVEGKKQGYGVYTFKDGSIYSGQYKNDIKDGYGELYIKSKDIYYKGDFKDGKFEGIGELYIQDKSTFIGKFKENQPFGKGILLDDKNNIIEVFVNNGRFNQKANYSFFDNFPFPQANAGFLSDTFNKIVNTVTTAVNDATEWTYDNVEHIVNSAKGCIAGGIGGAGTGAVTGAIVGTLAGPKGTVVGAVGGALVGGLNGCINQVGKAFEISKANNDNYTWNDAKQALLDEISIENAAVGAMGGLGATAVLFEKTVAASKVYQYLAIVSIASRVIVKTPAIKASIKFMSDKGKKIKESICKIGYMKKTSFCKPREKDDKNKGHIKSLKIISWNLQNFTPNTIIQKKNKIKKYIRKQFVKGVDIVFLQELQDKDKVQIHSNFFTPYNAFKSEYLGTTTHQERYVILIHPNLYKKLNIGRHQVTPIKLKSYIKYERPPFGLRLGKKLIVLNTHIIDGMSKYKRKTEALNWRKTEVKNIRKDLSRLLKYHRIQNNNYIVAGDFNLEKNDLQEFFKKAKISTNNLTTNKNSFDHIITNLPIKRDMVSTVNRANISDHSPIIITVELNKKATKSKSKL